MNNTQQKSFTDMLRERREFVMGSGYGGQGGGNPFPTTGQAPQDTQTQLAQTALQGMPNQDLASSLGKILAANQAFVPQANMSVAQYTDNALKNGSNGVYASPAALNTNALNYYGANNNTTNNLINSILGLAQTQQLKQAEMNQAQQFHNDDMNLQKAQQARENFIAGYDPTNGGANSSIIDLHVKNIKNGVESPGDIPDGLRPRVSDALTKSGYDPAKPVNDLVNRAEAEYLGKGNGDTGNPLGYGNNPFRHGAQIAGDLLSKIGLNTGSENQKNSYENLKQSFQSELSKLSGTSNAKTATITQLSNALPTESDPPEQAAKKFAYIRNAINDIYYNGSKPTANGGAGNNGNTIQVGKYTVQY